ncbi:MAG TPA: GrpB family protein [Acidimicrobiales bacterium]
MLNISTPTNSLRNILVELGAVAYPRIPEWRPRTDLIAVMVGADPADVHLTIGLDTETSDFETLWFERIRPFEANLRSGRRAPRRQQPVLVRPDPSWTEQAERLMARLSVALGSSIRRIDHIGSTSVPDLPAKDLIDIQVVVDDLAVALESAGMARRAGFVHAAGEWYGEDRDGKKHREEVVVDADPGRPANVNIRLLIDPVWKETLLFRNFLRADTAERDRYAEMKLSLALQGVGIDRYSELKVPYIRAALRRADARPL